jgi:hypothetical protein
MTLVACVDELVVDMVLARKNVMHGLPVVDARLLWPKYPSYSYTGIYPSKPSSFCGQGHLSPRLYIRTPYMVFISFQIKLFSGIF